MTQGWTDERLEALKKFWDEGLSASQIATELGGVTRNAIIGKVHRLKLSGRGRQATSQPKRTLGRAPDVAGKGCTKAPRKPRETIAYNVPPARDLLTQMSPLDVGVSDLSVVPVSRELGLSGLSEKTCKWPTAEPHKGDFSFCGNEVVDKSPYCSHHDKLAYQPARGKAGVYRRSPRY